MNIAARMSFVLIVLATVRCSTERFDDDESHVGTELRSDDVIAADISLAQCQLRCLIASWTTSASIVVVYFSLVSLRL